MAGNDLDGAPIVGRALAACRAKADAAVAVAPAVVAARLAAVAIILVASAPLVVVASAQSAVVVVPVPLLKFSLRTSNVVDGATQVRNMSKPKAKTNDVDSRRAGAVTIRCTLAA